MLGWFDIGMAWILVLLFELVGLTLADLMWGLKIERSEC